MGVRIGVLVTGSTVSAWVSESGEASCSVVGGCGEGNGVIVGRGSAGADAQAEARKRESTTDRRFMPFLSEALATYPASVMVMGKYPRVMNRTINPAENQTIWRWRRSFFGVHTPLAQSTSAWGRYTV